jgi:hypothetical protein
MAYVEATAPIIKSKQVATLYLGGELKETATIGATYGLDGLITFTNQYGDDLSFQMPNPPGLATRKLYEDTTLNLVAYEYKYGPAGKFSIWAIFNWNAENKVKLTIQGEASVNYSYKLNFSSKKIIKKEGKGVHGGHDDGGLPPPNVNIVHSMFFDWGDASSSYNATWAETDKSVTFTVGKGMFNIDPTITLVASGASTTTVGSHRCICRSPDGTIHIASNGGKHYHSHDNGATWDAGVTYANSHTVGSYSSIACNSAGRLVAFWQVASTLDLYSNYATYSAGAWTWYGTDTLVDTTTNWYMPRIICDNGDEFHACAYSDGETGKWYHGTTGASWTTVDTSITAYYQPDINVDKSRNIFIAYIVYGGLVYIKKSTYSGGSWGALSGATTVQASGAAYGGHLDIDMNDYLIVHYADGGSDDACDTWFHRSTSASDQTSWAARVKVVDNTYTAGNACFMWKNATTYRYYYSKNTAHAARDIYYTESTDSGVNWASQVAITNDALANRKCYCTRIPFGNIWDFVYIQGADPFKIYHFLEQSTVTRSIAVPMIGQ